MPMIISGTIKTSVSVGSSDGPVIITPSGYLGDGLFANDVSVTNLGVILNGSVILLGGGGFYNGVNAVVDNASPQGAGVQVGSGTWTITNAGLIYGNYYGVEFVSGAGTLFNAASGVIASRVLFENAVGNVTNAGRLTDVLLQAGGTVNNEASGLATDIVTEFVAATVTNAGAIVGASKWGVWLEAGGGVTNRSTGTIGGADYGVYVSGAAGTILNAGLISGTGKFGVWLQKAGVVTNLAGGMIGGAEDGVYNLGGVGSVTNAGTISGTTQFGVWLKAGGVVANQSAGTIGGASAGIYVTSAAGTVTNAGAVSASGSWGVWLKAGGTIANQAAGTISAANVAIYIGSGAETVSNAGDISGTNDGILGFSSTGGSVTNLSTGTIALSAASGIVFENGAGTVGNAGTITGLGTSPAIYGVWLIDGGSVTNQSTGIIERVTDGIDSPSVAAVVVNAGAILGTANGVVLDAGGTVTNSGTISGDQAAVTFAAGFVNQLIVDPGAVFSGAVNGGNTIGASGISELELASGATTGTLSGLGAQFANFAEIAIDSGASWTLTGTNALPAGSFLSNDGVLTVLDGGMSDGGSLLNNDLIQVDTATLTLAGLSGSGQAVIGGDSTLAISGAVAVSATVVFQGDGLLSLTPGSFLGQIENLAGGDIIELAGIGDATSAAIVNGDTLAVQQSSGPALDLTLAADQSYSGLNFSILAPGGSFGGNDVIDVTGPAGPLVISGGASDTLTGDQATTLAATAGGLGGITVTGQNSLLTTTTDAFVVGDTTLGSLAIDAAGAVETAVGAAIGDTAAADGSAVNVSGLNSVWQVAGGLVVGDAGSGALSLSDGATVTAVSFDVAAVATGSGDVVVSGAGSVLKISGALTLGDQGAGELSVLGGAQMMIGGGVVGSSKTAPGNLDVEGAGSHLTINSGTLTVGANGPAEFTLGIGATLSGELANGPFGVVSEYGTVDPATDPNDGTQNVGFGNSLIYDFYIANSGTIKITSGTATFYSPLVTDETNAADSSTSGLWVIGAHETLVMNTTSVDTTQTFDLTSPSAATLVIGQVPQPSTTATDTFNGQTMPALTGSIAPGSPNVLPGWDAPIENFANGDLIVLRGLTYGSATASGDVVTVWSQAGGQGSALGSLTFVTKSGAASSAEASLAATQINSLACFAAGTRIATANGWVAVENLRIGDAVTTADRPIVDASRRMRGHVVTGDAARHEPVVWVGSRTVDCARHPQPETVWPVRVGAHALARNVPSRDLYLSPDHAVFLNGVLIPVKLLINGTSVTRTEQNRVTYHHVELPAHAVILAEGLPVESYLDTGDRTNFGTGGTIRLYPDFASPGSADAALLWEAKGVAPLVLTGEKLNAARRALGRRAAASPGLAAAPSYVVANARQP